MNENKSDKEKAVKLFDEWTQKNRMLLPLNFKTWDIQTVDKNSNGTSAPITLGKYKSKRSFLPSFYKPISRIIQFTSDDE